MLVFLLSTVLITFSSIKLIFKYQSAKSAIALKINSYCHANSNLNNTLIYTINTQRFSMNLIYSKNSENIKHLTAKVISSRDSLKHSISLLGANRDISPSLKNSMVKISAKYLGLNTAFLKLMESGASVDTLEAYSIEKLRPCLEQVSGEKDTTLAQITAGVQQEIADEFALYNGTEFWLLLIGLLPFIYGLFSAAFFIFRLITAI